MAQLVAPLVSIHVVGLPLCVCDMGGDMDQEDRQHELRRGELPTDKWDKFLHTDDRYRKSVLMKTSDVKSKRR